MLCLLITFLIISLHQIDATQTDNHAVQPLIEYIRQRRHQVYAVEPNEYMDQKNYPKVTVTQHKRSGHQKQKHQKQKNVKQEKVKKNIRNRKIPHVFSDSEKIRKDRKHKEWVQESYKESNVSESDEKHSPVDIVVHIKMNE